jgi:hypothetical protein
MTQLVLVTALISSALLTMASPVYAYPSRAKIWVVPYSVLGSSDTSVGKACASFVQAALVSTQEGGQLLMPDDEVLLAARLTGKTTDHAMGDAAWVDDVAGKANVLFISRGQVSLQGSTFTVQSTFLRPSRDRGTDGKASSPNLVRACVKSVRAPLSRLDHFYPWSDGLFLVPDVEQQAAVIRAIGYIGGRRYALAADELEWLALSGNIDALYWRFQAFIGLGSLDRARSTGEMFLNRAPNDPRVPKVRAQIKDLPHAKPAEPMLDKA